MLLRILLGAISSGAFILAWPNAHAEVSVLLSCSVSADTIPLPVMITDTARHPFPVDTIPLGQAAKRTAVTRKDSVPLSNARIQPPKPDKKTGVSIKDTAVTSVSIGRVDSSTTPKPFITVRTQPAEPYMIRRVAFVNDFVNRLNYQRTPENKPFDEQSRMEYPRQRYVRMLFNEDDPRLNRAVRQQPEPAAHTESVAYSLLVEEFSKDVAAEQMAEFMPKDSTQLFGEVGYTVLYKNTPHRITFYLQQVHIRDYYKWEVLDVDAPFLVSGPSDSVQALSMKRDTMAFLSSETHETRFLDLYNQLRDHKNLLNILPNKQPASPSMALLAKYVRNDTINVQQTGRVNLYLDTRRGWLLRLHDFHREKENAGWLITELYNPQFKTALPPKPIERALRRNKPTK